MRQETKLKYRKNSNHFCIKRFLSRKKDVSFYIKYREGYENPKFRLTPGTWLGFLETKPNYQPGRYLSLALIFRRQEGGEKE
jgi:hypothetical protein